jgi:hypothetical protein
MEISEYLPFKAPPIHGTKNNPYFPPKTVAVKNDRQFDYVAQCFSMERGLNEEY